MDYQTLTYGSLHRLLSEEANRDHADARHLSREERFPLLFRIAQDPNAPLRVLDHIFGFGVLHWSVDTDAQQALCHLILQNAALPLLMLEDPKAAQDLITKCEQRLRAFPERPEDDIR